MSARQIIVILATGFSMLTTTLQAKPRSCRVVFPERPQDAPKIAYLFDGAKSQKVTLPSMNLSEVVELSNGELTIAMTPNEISDPKALPPNTPFLKIPEQVTDFYIIITPAPNNQVFPVKMNLADTGSGKIKPGETLWYNLTEHRIAAKLGNTEMLVAPNGSTISKVPVLSSGYYNAKFVYQANGKGEYAPITEQSWWCDTQSKHLGFIVDAGGKLPKIFFYRDFRDPEPTKTEAQ